MTLNYLPCQPAICTAAAEHAGCCGLYQEQHIALCCCGGKQMRPRSQATPCQFIPVKLLWLAEMGYRWVAQLKHVGVAFVQEMKGECGPRGLWLIQNLCMFCQGARHSLLKQRVEGCCRMSRNGFPEGTDTVRNSIGTRQGWVHTALVLVHQTKLIPCINSVVGSNQPLTVSLQKVQLDQGAIKLFCEYSGGPVKVGSVMFTSVEEFAEGVAHNSI